MFFKLDELSSSCFERVSEKIWENTLDSLSQPLHPLIVSIYYLVLSWNVMQWASVGTDLN